MAEEDIIEEYEQGDRVNALIEDEWRPGIIDEIESYTVFNPETRSQRDVAPGFIRGNIGVGNQIEFRANFGGVTPGFHMNKTHWNTVKFNEDVSDQMILEMVTDSYNLVVSSLTKKLKLELDML